MFEFSAYHLALAAFGLAIILAYWLPRFISGREPAASALLIGFGLLAFGWIPGMPAAIDPISLPQPWEKVSELCVVIGLFGVGLRIDRLADRKTWRPTIRLLVIAMPLCIGAIALSAWHFAGLALGRLLGDRHRHRRLAGVPRRLAGRGPVDRPRGRPRHRRGADAVALDPA